MTASSVGATETGTRPEGSDDTGDTGAGTEPRSGGDAGEPETLPNDVVFGLLSARRRRDVLEFLDAHGGESTLGEVAEHIAAEENGIEAYELSSTQRKRVYIVLYQSHLPRMADAGVIDYEQARGTIALRAEADQLFRYLSVDEPGPGRTLAGWVPERDRLAALRTAVATWIAG